MTLTWIYLIKDLKTGYYKIGKSIDPLRRVQELRRQDTLQPTPNEFELIEAWWADEKAEKELHQHFGGCRVRGEWFHLIQDDLIRLYQYFLHSQPHSRPFRVTPETRTIDALKLQVEAWRNMFSESMEEKRALRSQVSEAEYRTRRAEEQLEVSRHASGELISQLDLLKIKIVKLEQEAKQKVRREPLPSLMELKKKHQRDG